MNSSLQGFLKGSISRAGVSVSSALEILDDLANPDILERHFNLHTIRIDRSSGMVQIISEIESPEWPSGVCALDDLIDAIRQLKCVAA